LCGKKLIDKKIYYIIYILYIYYIYSRYTIREGETRDFLHMAYYTITPEFKHFVEFYNETEKALRIMMVLDSFQITETPGENFPEIFHTGWRRMTFELMHEVYGVPLNPQTGDVLYDYDGNIYTIMSEYLVGNITDSARAGFGPSWLYGTDEMFVYNPIRLVCRSAAEKNPFRGYPPGWQDEPAPQSFLDRWRPIYRENEIPDQWDLIFSQVPAGGYQECRIYKPFVSLLQTKEDDAPYMANSIIEAFCEPLDYGSRMYESRGINGSWEESWNYIYDRCGTYWPYKRIGRWAYLAGELDNFREYFVNGFPRVEVRGTRISQPEETFDLPFTPEGGGIPPLIAGGLLSMILSPQGLFGIKLHTEGNE
jgi:hypothetical protein